MIKFLNKILNKYKLQENVEWEVDERKDIIIDKLKKQTNESYYSAIFVILDLTAPKQKEFIGTITNKGFLIRKKIKMFDYFPDMTKVKAEFKSIDGKNKISAKINGMQIVPFAIRLLILAFISLLVFLMIFEALISPIGAVNPFPELLILLFLASIFILIPYLLAVRNVRIMKTKLNGIIGKEKNL